MNPRTVIALVLLASLSAACSKKEEPFDKKIALVSPTQESETANSVAVPESPQAPEPQKEESEPPVQASDDRQANAPIVVVPPPKPEELVKQYQESVEKNDDPQAHFQLGMMYLLGKGGLEANREKAIEHLRAAANKGDARAQDTLASLLLNANGGAGREQSLSLYESAASKGDVQAMRNAAFVLAYDADGNLVHDKARIDKARKYLEKAAAQGNLFAQADLGVLAYNLGETARAVDLLRVPANDGIPYAIEQLDVIAQAHPELIKTEEVEAIRKKLKTTTAAAKQSP